MEKTKSMRSLRNAVVFMRMLIGWHFLYEGIVKLYNPDWTSLGYLSTAQGPFQSLFRAMTAESVIGIMDNLNMAALVFVGLALLLGAFEKWGALVGMFLLALYYLAHPPFPGLLQVNVEGNYWFVNKNLIEFAACLVIFRFPTARYFGLARWFGKDQEQ